MKKLNLEWQETHVDREQELYSIKKAGVYLYTSYDRTIMIYVGKGDPIEERLREHIENKASNPELYEYLNRNSARLYYAEIGREEDRKAVEFFLFKLLNPLYNKISPEETEILMVNLPKDIERD